MKMMMMMRLAAALLSSLHSLGVLLLCFPLALLTISSSSSSFSRLAALAQTPPNTTTDPVDGAYLPFPSLLLLSLPYISPVPAFFLLISLPLLILISSLYMLYFEFPMSLNKRDFSIKQSSMWKFNTPLFSIPFPSKSWT